MSGKVSGWVWDLELPQNEKFVLLAYADHADHEGHNVFPSIALICKKTGYSRRSIQTITKRLMNKGLLVPEGGQQGGRGISAHWSIPIMGAKSAPIEEERVQSETERAQPRTEKGAELVAPEPSLTVNNKETSVKEGVDIPETLKTKDFIFVWNEWIDYRKHKRQTLTDLTAKKQLKKLAKYGLDAAIWALDESMTQGWTGIFPEKHNANGGISRKPAANSGYLTPAEAAAYLDGDTNGN